MRVLIIGAGAVGSFIGGRLALAGHEVVLVGRPALVEAVRAAGGLTLIEPDGRRQTAPVHAVESIAAAFTVESKPGFLEKPGLPSFSLSPTATFDFALITVKAYDTATVIAELSAATTTPPPLLTLQNGVGNEEALAEAFGSHRIVAGAIDTPISVPAAGQVQAHRPRFRAGVAPVDPGRRSLLRAETSPDVPPDPGRRSLLRAETSPDAPPDPGRRSLLRAGASPGVLVVEAATLLRDAGFRTEIFTDHRRLKWTKLLLNLPANAQCAILDWTPAQVMADPVAARLEALAWQEALAVMAAMGIRPVTLAGYPVGLLAPVARRVWPWLLAAVLRRLAAGGRGSKMPSLHMALAAGKRSEVNWLNGAVARYGAQLGVATPVNRVLAETLTALTEKREEWDAWRGQPARLAAAVRAQRKTTGTMPTLT